MGKVDYTRISDTIAQATQIYKVSLIFLTHATSLNASRDSLQSNVQDLTLHSTRMYTHRVLNDMAIAASQ